MSFVSKPLQIRSNNGLMNEANPAYNVCPVLGCVFRQADLRFSKCLADATCCTAESALFTST